MLLLYIIFYFNTIAINKTVSSINSYFLDLARRNRSEKELQNYCDDPEHDSYKSATDCVYRVMLILSICYTQFFKNVFLA